MLTDITIRNTKPGAKPIKLSDGGGLYLLVQPSGGKWWHLDYRFNDKRKTLSLGVYPDVNLKDARDRRDQARKLLANGIDPAENRKAQKTAKADRAANSFEVIAREWYTQNLPTWAATHSSKIIRRFEMYVFPWLGGWPIADIAAPELLAVARRVADLGALESAPGRV